MKRFASKSPSTITYKLFLLSRHYLKRFFIQEDKYMDKCYMGRITQNHPMGILEIMKEEDCWKMKLTESKLENGFCLISHTGGRGVQSSEQIRKSPLLDP